MRPQSCYRLDLRRSKAHSAQTLGRRFAFLVKALGGCKVANCIGIKFDPLEMARLAQTIKTRTELKHKSTIKEAAIA